MPNPARQQRIFVAVLEELRSLGYVGGLLQRNYAFQDWFGTGQPFRQAPAVAFGQTPVSYGTSCFVILKADGRPGSDLISEYRALGAPIAFEVKDNSVIQWKVTTAPKASDVSRIVPANELTKVFKEAGATWAPSAVLRAKNIVGSSQSQIEMDFGLLPSIESEIRIRLDPLLRECLFEARQLAEQGGNTSLDTTILYRIVFWFLAGKVFHDREIAPFSELSVTSNASDVLRGVADYYNEKAPSAPRRVLDYIHERLWSGFDFRNLSVDILAMIYENTLVDENLRSEHGIHATPPSLARYVVNNLPFEDFSEEDRIVTEPCCGHGTFLLAAMQRLRDLLPTSYSSKKRHDYLRRILIGFEIDSFAVEIARLSLMLADFPNEDGWQLHAGTDGDVLRSPKFSEELQRTNFVLCNPPFSPFSISDRKRFNVRSINMPGEILHRVLDDLKPTGVLGFIVPNMFIDGREYRSIRERLVERFDVLRVVSLPDQGVFQQAEIETAMNGM